MVISLVVSKQEWKTLILVPGFLTYNETVVSFYHWYFITYAKLRHLFFLLHVKDISYLDVIYQYSL